MKSSNRFGKLLFNRSAEELLKQMSKEECQNEPSYKRLWEIISGKKPVRLNRVTGNYYHKHAILPNHCDMPNIFLPCLLPSALT